MELRRAQYFIAAGKENVAPAESKLPVS